MADERPKSAMIRRHEQLQRWKESELAKTSDSRKNKKTKVKFQAGCVFLAACASGDDEDVQHLLNIGADINYANIDGLTALHQAVIDENQDMVEFLLENGANIESQDNEGWTPLHAAASCGFIDIASFLIESGANVAAVNNEGEIPLDLAEEEDMEEFLEEQIDKAGIDAEEARSEEETIMLRDAKQWLNNKNVKEKKHPTTGACALHVAASKGYMKVMELLLQNNADVNIKDCDGWTPLHAASHWGQKEAVELLVENMADMDAKNKLGQTAFDLADADDMLPYLAEMKKKQASVSMMKKDTKPAAPRIDGKIPPPLKRSVSIMKRSSSDTTHRLSISGSSVTRISVPDKNLLIHQDMEKERRELAMKIHGKTSQDKKTMESSSSSESETDPSSSEEEEEEEEVKKPEPVQNRKPPNLPPVSKPPPSPAGGKKELPSFSPKPLAPAKQDSKEAETPAWRTGLRKTGSTILPESKKPDERLPRSASAPKIAEQKTNTDNKWQNERLGKPEDKKTVTIAKPPLRARIAEEKKEVEKPKSFMAPSKEEEAETVRRARAKRERSSRRSTQGVTAEDIESAVSSIRGDKKVQVDNKLADKHNEEDPLQRRPVRPGRSEKEEPEVSTDSLRKPEEKAEPAPVATFIARPRVTATVSNDSSSSSTIRLSPRYNGSKTDDIKEKEREKEKEKDNDEKSPRRSTAFLRRKPREKRRGTGIIHREEDEQSEESASESEESEEEEKPAPKSTDRFSRPGVSSRVGGDSSTTATVDRYGSRADRNSSAGSYSTRDKDKTASTPCASCKKIVDEKDSLISKLQKDVKSKDVEIADLKSQVSKSGIGGRSGTSDNDKRERRALERRISELEEEVKEEALIARHHRRTVKQLKADNQRLKDENGALVRVISKLSK
ncbi:protein phosphatase 1 regulatory subunit 12B-like isoform X4 [Apostichopus japonicus]|uniref:protein phosphatase 1 regulatory subunit 12B-like isoform X4 n=1 Tax=Stichopus japonicus TaxID=307972 RepID=UPI003AB4732F